MAFSLYIRSVEKKKRGENFVTQFDFDNKKELGLKCIQDILSPQKAYLSLVINIQNNINQNCGENLLYKRQQSVLSRYCKRVRGERKKKSLLLADLVELRLELVVVGSLPGLTLDGHTVHVPVIVVTVNAGNNS